jgi:ribonucleoside-diphosphate reductase subunit M2
MYSLLRRKLEDREVHGIVDEAVSIEREFMRDGLPVALIGMNSRLMEQYIQFVADRLLVALGHEKLYYVSNPFDFMDLISLQGKTNFFERKVSEYRLAGVMTGGGGGENNNNHMFVTTADF